MNGIVAVPRDATGGGQDLCEPRNDEINRPLDSSRYSRGRSNDRPLVLNAQFVLGELLSFYFIGNSTKVG